MPSWPLDLPLLQLTPSDRWTLERAVSGVIILGATRSGKTSGPFQYIMRSFLRAGFGGIFFCVKPESMTDYLKFTRSENMTDSGDPAHHPDLILFGPGHGHQFNFLTHEMRSHGRGKAIIENIVALLMQASEVLARRTSSGKKGDFFDIAMRQLLRNCLEVVIAATDKIELDEMPRRGNLWVTGTFRIGGSYISRCTRRRQCRIAEPPFLFP